VNPAPSPTMTSFGAVAHGGRGSGASFGRGTVGLGSHLGSGAAPANRDTAALDAAWEASWNRTAPSRTRGGRNTRRGGYHGGHSDW
jgi:hypothetical protein